MRGLKPSTTYKYWVGDKGAYTGLLMHAEATTRAHAAPSCLPMCPPIHPSAEKGVWSEMGTFTSVPVESRPDGDDAPVRMAIFADMSVAHDDQTLMPG
jgi:hypothetical protein